MEERLATYISEKWSREGRVSLLDFGCRDGKNTIIFVKKGFWVTAADETETHVIFLRQWEKQYGKILRSKCCKLEQLPFAENAFDCVWAYQSMMGIDQATALQRLLQIKRVLKPAGVFYCLIETERKEAWISLCEKEKFELLNEKEETSGVTSVEFALRKEFRALDFSNILGTVVSGKIDRPLGSWHSVYKNLYYPVNYGYVEGVLGGDEEEQDVYLLGEMKAVSEFCGVVVAVVHRLNDVEDKWVVDASGKTYTKEEIEEALAFQEKYFCSEIYVWNRK